jgi:zinc transport system ATP-binding protein
VPLSDHGAALRYDRAVLGYGDRPVTGPLTIRVDSGEVLALLGPNGSGKSTVVKGALGLSRLFAGAIAVGPDAEPARRGRSRIGYVPQRLPGQHALPMTVAEFVGAGLLPTAALLRRDARRGPRVPEALSLVDLLDAARRPIATLSGGQQRRALIARALVSAPRTLLLDEPLAGVDRANQEQLSRVLHRVAGTGTTILLVLHEVGPLLPLIPRVLALSDGALAYDGPTRPADVRAAEFIDHQHGEDPPPGPLRPPTATPGRR